MATAGPSDFTPVPFGAEMRKQHFTFADGYHPLNHGSFGAFPKVVQEYQRQLQSESEARPDTFLRYTYPVLLEASRTAVAPLLGADPGEVVLIPNATTGLNTVLRNLHFEEGDVIIYFNTIYGGFNNTIHSLSETTPVSSHKIDITYPIEDEEILRRFKTAVQDLKAQGKLPKLAMFDIVLTFPGALFPWEALVAACKEFDIMSFIDGAHGVGHTELTHLAAAGPDFMVSNCYKWLMTPRGSAILYVPFRNQKLIATTVPTSVGYKTPGQREKADPREYFSRLFDRVATVDGTPYCCIPLALKFRKEVCGGEAAIRAYCEDIARRGGDRMAEILGTEVLGGPESSFRRCCMVNVRLPVTLSDLGVDESCGNVVAKWMQELGPAEYETYIPTKFYDGGFWCRISGQIYLGVEDFEWAARTLLVVCERVRAGEWKTRY